MILLRVKYCCFVLNRQCACKRVLSSAIARIRRLLGVQASENSVNLYHLPVIYAAAVISPLFNHWLPIYSATCELFISHIFGRFSSSTSSPAIRIVRVCDSFRPSFRRSPAIPVSSPNLDIIAFSVCSFRNARRLNSSVGFWFHSPANQAPLSATSGGSSKRSAIKNGQINSN